MHRPIAMYLGTMGILLNCLVASADTFDVVPVSPTSTDLLQVRLAFEACSETSAASEVNLATRRILVHVNTTDTCDASNPLNTTSPRLYPIGRLPAGQYTVSYQTCPFNPGPQVPCTEFLTQSLTVTDAMTRSVPTLSAVVLLALVAMAATAGLIARSGVGWSERRF